jgi:hypothetical protein
MLNLVDDPLEPRVFESASRFAIRSKRTNQHLVRRRMTRLYCRSGFSGRGPDVMDRRLDIAEDGGESLSGPEPAR